MAPGKPFEYTPKGTIRRELTLEKYADDINQLYEITQGSNLVQIGKPSSLGLGDVAAFVRNVVVQILNKDIVYEDDIFRAGADR